MPDRIFLCPIGAKHLLALEFNRQSPKMPVKKHIEIWVLPHCCIITPDDF